MHVRQRPLGPFALAAVSALPMVALLFALPPSSSRAYSATGPSGRALVNAASQAAAYSIESAAHPTASTLSRQKNQPSTLPGGAGTTKSDLIVVKGQLVDEAGHPVARARVWAAPPRSRANRARWLVQGTDRRDDLSDADRPAEQPNIVPVRTNARGRFELRVHPGIWTIHLKHSNHPPAELTGWLPLWRDTAIAPILMRPKAALTVQVVDPAGQAIQGARLIAKPDFYLGKFMLDGRTIRVGGGTSRARTNASGLAELTVVDGATDVTVVAPGYLPASAKVQSFHNHTFTLEPADTTKLVLLHQDGSPATGVVAYARGVSVAVSDQHGEISVPVSMAGPTAIGLVAPNLEWTETTLTTNSSNRKPLRLRAPYAVEARVLDEATAQPVPHAWLLASPTHPTVTDSEGKGVVLVPGLRADPDTGPNRTHLLAAAPEYFASFQRLRHIDSDHDFGDVKIARASAVRGRVVDAQQRPLEGVLVMAAESLRSYQTRASAFEPTALSRSDGQFTVWPVDASRPVILSARKPKYARLEHTVPLTDDLNQAVVLTMQRGLLVTGTVVDKADVAIGGARVQLVRRPAGGQQPTSRDLLEAYLREESQPSSVTDTAGVFRFHDQSAGTFDLRVQAPSFAPAIVPGVKVHALEGQQTPSTNSADIATTTPATTVELGTVTLSPGAVITGRVETSDGAPVPGASVQTSTKTSNSLVSDSQELRVQTDELGHFRFDSLALSQPHTVQVTHQDYLERRQTVPAGWEDEVVLTLHKGTPIEGVVTNAALEPIEGAYVGASAVDIDHKYVGPRPSVKTDAHGKFRLENLAKGTWSLQIGAAGYLSNRTEQVTVGPDHPARPVTVRLKKGIELNGTVTDTNGEPVPGVRIETPGNSTLGVRSTRGQTDQSGHYRVPRLLPGAYSFQFSAEGYSSTVRDVQLSGSSDRLDVQLQGHPTISGTVYSPDGSPAAGAQIARVDPLRPVAGFSARQPQTGIDGQFTLTVPPGLHQVSARLKALPEARLDQPVLVESTDVAGLEIHLREGSSVYGNLAGLSVDELAQARVWVRSVDRSHGNLNAQPDFEGNYRINGLSPGEWSASAAVGSRRAESQRFTVPGPESEHEINLELTNGFALTGIVLRNGEPAADRSVSAASSEHQAQATTTPAGTFSMKDLPRGTYEIKVSGVYNARTVDTIHLTGDDDIVVELTDQTVTLRIIDEMTQVPVANATAMVRTDGANSFSAQAFRPSGDDGMLTIDEIPAGTHRLDVSAHRYATKHTRLTVQPSVDPPVIEVALSPAAPLTVHVQHEAGYALTEVTVVGLDEENNQLFWEPIRLGQGGRAVVGSAPPGTYTLGVSAHGAASAHTTVTVPPHDAEQGAEVQVVLPVPGKLHVYIPELVSQRADYKLTNAAGREPVRAARSGNSTMWGGVITRGDLAPGTYTLTVTSRDSDSSFETQVQIYANQITRLELR